MATFDLAIPVILSSRRRQRAGRTRVTMDAETLKERLKDWREFDCAEGELAVVLGIFPEWGAGPGKDPWHGLKGVVWSANKAGDMLAELLTRMVEAGVLLKDEEGRFKWNPDFQIRDEGGSA